jgi:alpha-ribazole phosphatase/probable phosphoglycerate mutase
VRLILIRHAEPAEDARGRCYGSLDVDLSPAGRAALRGLRLPPLDAVYASPRRRALETAAALGEPVVLDGLRELDFGELEGRTYDEIAAERPELYRAWMETPTEVAFPGGESFRELRERAVAAVDVLRVQHDGETVAAVTHGGVVRAVLGHVLRMPDEAIFRLEQRYLAVNVVEWLGDFPLVRLVNGTHYD